MRPLALALLVLGLSAPAHADVVYPSPVVRRAMTARLSSLRLAQTDAPAADASQVERQARRRLQRSQGRITRCLDGVDLRRDPLQSSGRTLSGRLTFTRSARPRVQIDRVRGFPPAARSCVAEVLRGMAVDTTPRGTVELRFSYRLR